MSEISSFSRWSGPFEVDGYKDLSPFLSTLFSLVWVLREKELQDVPSLHSKTIIAETTRGTPCHLWLEFVTQVVLIPSLPLDAIFLTIFLFLTRQVSLRSTLSTSRLSYLSTLVNEEVFSTQKDFVVPLRPHPPHLSFHLFKFCHFIIFLHNIFCHTATTLTPPLYWILKK